MAPELLAGRRGDGRADLYSLGLTLHFALAGRLPDRISAHAPVPASSEGYRPGRLAGAVKVPAWLDDLVARTTVAAPERRFPSAKAMEDALAEGAAAGGAHSIRAETVERCALCHEVDPFGLGLCVRCGGTSPHTADRAIVVRPPARSGEREALRQAVHQLLGGRVEAGAANAAAAGERILLRVPATSAGTVLEHLAEHGVPARAVMADRVWGELPVKFYGLVMAIAVMGVAAGTVVPLLAWASPAVAGIWWVLAYREMRRPALASVGLATRLPPAAEREVVAALTELPEGTARELLADVVRVGQRMTRAMDGAEAAERTAEVGKVLAGASRAARQVAGLEESLASLERRADSGTDPRLIGAADVLERGRDRLVQELLEVLTAMGRTQGRLALASQASSMGGDELATLALELEKEIAFRADARREVEEILRAK
jgi:hypothetical protein